MNSKTKYSSQPKIYLQILRGIHVPEYISELVDMCKDSDVILLEFLGTKEVRNSLLEVMNLVLANEYFVNQLELDNGIKEAYINSWHTKIAWEFRLSGKYIFLVDKNDCIDEAEVQEYMFSHKLTSIFDDIPELLRDRYSTVEKLLNEEYETLKYRDSLTSRQTSNLIKMLTKSEEFKSSDSIKTSIVLGHLHDIERELITGIPDATITQDYYGKDMYKKLNAQPVNALINKKIEENGKAVSKKLIDYYLFSVFLISESIENNKHSESHFNVTTIMHTGGIVEYLEKFGVNMENTNIRDIDSYTDHELKGAVDKYLAAYKEILK